MVDAVLWYINMEKNNINYVITTFVIPFILSLQIFYNIFIINKKRSAFISLLAIAMIIIILFKNQLLKGYGLYTYHSKNMFSSPLWNNKEPPLYFLFLFLLLIFYGRIGFSGEKLIFLCIIFSSLLFSLLFSGGFGTLWCSFANILALYYLYKY